MATITSSSTLFTPELVKETFGKVKGHSSLAKLCAMSAIPFAGNDYFTFTITKRQPLCVSCCSSCF